MNICLFEVAFANQPKKGCLSIYGCVKRINGYILEDTSNQKKKFPA